MGSLHHQGETVPQVTPGSPTVDSRSALAGTTAWCWTKSSRANPHGGHAPSVPGMYPYIHLYRQKICLQMRRRRAGEAPLGPSRRAARGPRRSWVSTSTNWRCLRCCTWASKLREHPTRRVTRVHIDNSTTVAHLRKEGGTRSWPLTRLTFRILKWCDKHGVSPVPVHIAGVRDFLADSLSRRGQLQGSEWALSPHEVDRVFSHVGWPSTDLMTTAANRVVSQFISPIPHPDALGVDVFVPSGRKGRSTCSLQQRWYPGCCSSSPECYSSSGRNDPTAYS